MTEPVIAKKGPYVVELEPGDYWWCACGQSKNQPICDGSHKETEFSPKKFTITEKESITCAAANTPATNPFATAVIINCN